MNINELEQHETRIWQTYELGGLKILAVCLAAFLMAVLLALCGCSVPVAKPVQQPATLPPMPPQIVSKAVIGQPRVILIGTNGNCLIYTNTVLHRATTNCPEIVQPRLEYFMGTAQGVWLLQGSNDLKQWQTLATNLFCLFQMQSKVPVFKQSEKMAFYRMVKE